MSVDRVGWYGDALIKPARVRIHCPSKHVLLVVAGPYGGSDDFVIFGPPRASQLKAPVVRAALSAGNLFGTVQMFSDPNAVTPALFWKHHRIIDSPLAGLNILCRVCSPTFLGHVTGDVLTDRAETARASGKTLDLRAGVSPPNDQT